MMNYVENAMPRLLGCPDKVAGFYDNLDVADDERLHAIGVSIQCSRQRCTRVPCPFRPDPKPSLQSAAQTSMNERPA
jgi:hypothetical protein